MFWNKKRSPFSSKKEAVMFFANPLNYGIEVHKNSSLYESNKNKVFVPLMFTDKSIILNDIGEVSFDDIFKHFVLFNTDDPVGIYK